MVWEHLSLSDFSFLVVTALLGAVYAVVVWRVVFQTPFLTMVRSLFGKMHEALQGKTSHDEMDNVVHEKMQESRLSNMRGLLTLQTHLFPFFVLLVLGEILVGRGEKERLRSVVQLMGVAMAFPTQLFPRLLTVRRLRPWQCASFLCWCVQIAPGVCVPSSLPRASRLSGLFITASQCALLDSPMCVAQHLLYVSIATVSIYTGHTDREVRRRHLGLELVGAVVSIMSVVMMEHLVEAQHRSNLEAQCLAEKEVANTKLLSVFYEVVLEVDSDLTIVSSQPDLRLFLPQSASSPIPSLLGTRLDELLEDEQDRQHLRQHAARPPVGEEASVEVMHLKMRHGHNDCLNVELFSLCFRGLGGRWRQLLGVRQFGDDSRTCRSSVAEQVLTLRVDTLDRNLPIAEISRDLQHQLGGAAPGMKLCQVVDDPAEFTWQLDKAVNTVACDDGLDPSASFRVVLRPLGQRSFLLATCCVTMDDAEGEPMNYMANLSFSNLTPVLQQQPSGASVSSRSSSSRGSGRLRGTPRELCSRPLGPTIVVKTMSL